MFENPILAQAGGGSDIVSMLIPFAAVAAIMYFLIFRPQRNQMKQREAMLNAIRRNDTVVTGGGIVGKVTKVIDDNEVEVEISKEVRIRVLRALIADVRSKSEPVAAKEAANKK